MSEKRSRIKQTFNKLRSLNKKAFIPYIMAGDPNLEKTKQNVHLLESIGADIIELGVPFSDPLADGPTIQRAAERALKAGVTLKKVLNIVREIRLHSEIPIVLMTYYNPVFKYGEEDFVKDSVKAGVDGVIIPDLPVDEAKGFIKLANKANLDTIFLVAPTSTEDRIKKIVSACSGFVYYVSLTGITGSKFYIDDRLLKNQSFIKKISDKPVAIGFGVSTPDDVKKISEFCDGIIIGSAIVKRLNEHPEGAEEFIKKLREAI